MTATFAFAPGLTLGVAGQPAAVEQMRSEYGPCEVADTAPAALEVVFGSPAGGLEARPGDVAAPGGHKTVRWHVTLGRPAEAPLRAWISIDGWPPAFARSLVQGYVIEPLLSIAAARTGHVLLPGAGIVADDGLLVVIGRSRAGKSTIAARALANGRRVLGDDQVLVDAGGAWRPFPRRLRFYPDLAVAAPAAFARLTMGSRRQLRVRGLVSTMTGGFVRPSLAVLPAELGATWSAASVPATRIALVERRPDVDRLVVEPATTDRALDWAAAVLAEQRARLASIGGATWLSTLEETASAEARLLRSALAGIPVQAVVVPVGWTAAEGIARTAAALGLEPGP